MLGERVSSVDSVGRWVTREWQEMVEVDVRHLEFGAAEVVIGVADVLRPRPFCPGLGRKASWTLLSG